MTAPGYKVLLTTAFFEPGSRAGGPIKSISQIIDTARPEIAIKTLTKDRDLGALRPYPTLSGNWVQRGYSDVFYLNTSSPKQWRKLTSQLRRETFDLLYCNSLWEPHFSILPIMAAQLGIIRARQILVAPRGELSLGALGLKNQKKKAFLTLWRPLLDSPSVVWHASTKLEAEDIRTVWPAARVEIVEDQTSLPESPITPEVRVDETLRAVYIGRISPMKNLLLTLNALTPLKGRIEFSIYGPIEDQRYWSQCEEVITQMPANVRVIYHGALEPEGVRSAFAENDVFLFPTLGENFGHVIAESLSASCPVYCSDATPWTQVLESGGGLVLRDQTAAAMTEAVQTAIDMPAERRYTAKTKAANAYRNWRRQTQNQNILERMMASRHQPTTPEDSR